ncbi:MAG: hypothetical protein ACT4P6_09885 [Gemmatimonadaceae bacterium]
MSQASPADLLTKGCGTTALCSVAALGGNATSATNDSEKSSPQRNGYLWLGSSETIGTHRELFEVGDTKLKLYSRKATIGPALQGRLIAHSGKAGVDAR